MHANSLEIFTRFGLRYIRRGAAVLEIGPDPDRLCRGLVERAGAEHHFADVANHSRDLRGFVAMRGEYRIECPDDAFDAVFSLSVVEHVRMVWRWFAELKRVVRPGGFVIGVNPVSWPYHEAPVDCWRLFPEAYKALFDEAGLEHVFSWHGNLVPIDAWLRDEHGPHAVTDTIAVARKAG